jgi:hypothetical protein
MLRDMPLDLVRDLACDMARDMTGEARPPEQNLSPLPWGEGLGEGAFNTA